MKRHCHQHHMHIQQFPFFHNQFHAKTPFPSMWQEDFQCCNIFVQKPCLPFSQNHEMYNSWLNYNCINQKNAKTYLILLKLHILTCTIGTDLPLIKNVTLSSLSHSARRRGCTLVVNLNPAFSFIKTTPAGTEALKGEIILHIPDIYHRFKWKMLGHNSITLLASSIPFLKKKTEHDNMQVENCQLSWIYDFY